MNTVSTNRIRSVAVIGGGISGLAAAHRLCELAPSTRFTLYEAQNRLGGVIHSERREGFLLEHSADMFTTRDPWATSLCDRIGLANELIGTNDAHRRAFVVRRGRLHPVPEGFTLMSPARIWPMVTTGILSPWGKLRLGCEYFVPPRRDESDESLAEFTTRRLGREAYERLVQPLISGMYTADPTKLSMQAAMAQFVAMESEHGSLIRGMRQTVKEAKHESGSGARYGMFVAPRGGMGQLVDAIQSRLPDRCIRLNHAVSELTHDQQGWSITSSPGGTQRYDAVILATRAHVSAKLLRPVTTELADELEQIPYASAAILIAGYRRDQITHPLDGFGAVVPLCERRSVLSISFSSVKFSGRAPDGCVLLRTFVGGACQANLLEHTDDELQRIVCSELAELLGARGTPLLCKLIRWPNAMPQYHLGHVERAARIARAVESIPRLALAGNAYQGVGVPFCVHSGEQAAESVISKQ